MRAPRARSCSTSLDSHDLDVDAKVGSLSVANRQRVEIAKALSQNARVLIMDEPTAALADADVQRLMAIVRRLRERGVGIIYISHRCRRSSSSPTGSRCCATARYVGTRPIAEVDRADARRDDGRPRRSTSSSPRPRRRSASRSSSCATSPIGDRRPRRLASTLRAGEILGLAGLVGSGRTELALTIFGITPATVGRDPARRQAGDASTAPRQARDLGIAYVPEDRGLQGLVRPHDHRARTSRWPSSTGSPRLLHRSRRARARWRADADRAASASGPAGRSRSSASSPAATSRRSCSASGSRPSRAS